MKKAAKKIVFVIAGIFFIVLTAVAQKSEFHWEQLNEESNRLEGKLTGTVFVLSSKSNSGYFLQNDWADGSVMLEDNDVYDGLKLRYNAFEDKLVVYNNNLRNLFTVDKEKVKSFTVKSLDGEHKFARYFYDGYPAGDRYFEVLYNGERDFLAFRQIVEEKTRPFVDKFGIMKDTRFRKTTSYYIHSPETGFQKIRLKRRSILTLFPENKREIRRLLRRNRVNTFEEKGMIRAIKLLDENDFLK